MKRHFGILAAGGCAAVIGVMACALPVKVMADPPATLAAVDQDHLLHDSFVEARRTSAIPVAVKHYISNGGPTPAGEGGKDLDFYMANPGQPYQASDDIHDPTLPGRRLIFTAKSKSYVFLEYESGGIAHRVHAELYKFDDSAWRANKGRYSPPQPTLVWQTYIHQNYKNLAGVRAAVASNAIN